jgi:predicted enzyme related to lactoylglutathione lyase
MANSIVHFEIPAQDTKRARSFYESVFGWSFREPMEGFEYHMTEGVEPVAGLYPQQSGEQGPIVYFSTDEIDGAVAKVRDAGGEADEKQPIPQVGWFARCKDTEGNPFSLFQADDTVPAPGER